MHRSPAPHNHLLPMLAIPGTRLVMGRLNAADARSFLLRSLDGARYRVLTWKEGTLRQIPMPALEGQAVVPAALSPLGAGTGKAS